MQNRSVVAEQSFIPIPIPVELALAADMFAGGLLRMTAEKHKITIELIEAEEKDEETVENNDFDKPSLFRDYENFVLLHDQYIEELKKLPKTLASMGIVRKAS